MKTEIIGIEEPANTKAPPVEFLLEWGRQGSAPGEFHFPIDIAITPDDEIFVTDFYNGRVQKFCSEGRLLSVFPVAPNPGGLALDSDCNLYISHFGAMLVDEEKKPDKITVYDNSGAFLREWGKTGSAAGEFDFPGGIAISGEGLVYIADQTNHRIQVFDTDGNSRFQWGTHGIEHGQFGGNVSALSRVAGPQFITLDGAGHVFTTEGAMGRVQKFSVQGEFLLSWGDNSDEVGSFGGPWLPGTKLQGPICICVDLDKNVWVSTVSSRILCFTLDGKFLQSFSGERGSGPAQFLAPHGLAVDSKNDLYVVDSFNHRIQKFSI